MAKGKQILLWAFQSYCCKSPLPIRKELVCLRVHVFQIHNDSNITKQFCLINFATKKVFLTSNLKKKSFFLLKISIFCLSKLAYSHSQVTLDIPQLSCINRSCLITFQLPPKSTHKVCCWSSEVVQWPWSFSNLVIHLMQAQNQFPCLLRTQYLL